MRKAALAMLGVGGRRVMVRDYGENAERESEKYGKAKGGTP